VPDGRRATSGSEHAYLALRMQAAEESTSLAETARAALAERRR
jgi:hypothetical protein